MEDELDGIDELDESALPPKPEVEDMPDEEGEAPPEEEEDVPEEDFVETLVAAEDETIDDAESESY
jgi:hypothetical protein